MRLFLSVLTLATFSFSPFYPSILYPHPPFPSKKLLHLFTPLKIHFPFHLSQSLLFILLHHLVNLLIPLSSMIVPVGFKTAAIRPLLKKLNFDHIEPATYRPMSFLPFSKILEHLYCFHIASFNLDEQFHLVFK